MIDLDTTKADDLFKVLFLLAPVMGMVTARTIMLAQMKLNGEPTFRTDKLMRFTVNDFTVIFLTLATSLPVIITAFRTASPGYIIDFLTAVRHELGVTGWAMTIIWWLHVTAPFAVGLMLYIGRRRRFKKFGHVAHRAREFGLYLG